MARNRIFPVAAALAFVGLVGCDGADRGFEQTETEVFTEPATETVEVPVVTEDTFMVERTVETDVSIDTTQIGEGDVTDADVDLDADAIPDADPDY